MNENLLGRADQTQTLIQRANLDETALTFFRPGMTTGTYLEQLIAGEQFLCAIRFLAWALGRREAVWWACQCCQQVTTEKDRPKERQALEAALKWATSPGEENRRLAESAAAAVDYATPAGCAAMAAFWSGGSMTPPKAAAIPPPEHLLPGAVANSIILAAVKREPEKAAEKYRAFLVLGRAVAAGTNRWKEEKPTPVATTRKR
jgi:hypothetical protein